MITNQKMVSTEMQELSLFLQSYFTKSRKVDLESKHLFLCAVDSNDVQFGCSNIKIGEGFSWMKGYIDGKLLHSLLLVKVLKILTDSNERRLDFHKHVLANFNYELLCRVFVKVGIYLQLIQIFVRLFLQGENVNSIFYWAIDTN